MSLSVVLIPQRGDFHGSVFGRGNKGSAGLQWCSVPSSGTVCGREVHPDDIAGRDSSIDLTSVSLWQTLRSISSFILRTSTVTGFTPELVTTQEKDGVATAGRVSAQVSRTRSLVPEKAELVDMEYEWYRSCNKPETVSLRRHRSTRILERPRGNHLYVRSLEVYRECPSSHGLF
jgi:hypothetical protein